MRIWVKTVFILTSRKTEIARSARRPKLQSLRAEDVLAEPYFVQAIWMVWLQQITKFSVKVVNIETIFDMQSWCRTWPPNGSSRIRAKQKLLRKRRRSCKSSWRRTGSLKSFTLTILRNLPRLVKIFPGIIVRRHHPDRTQMGLLREQCAEWKKVRLQYCCNHVWMKIGGQFSMECYTYLRNVTDLLSDVKTPYERRFGQPFKTPIIPFGSLVEYYLVSVKHQSRIHQFGKNVLLGLFLGYALYARWNLEGWHTGCRPWGFGDDGRIGNLLEKTECERGDISQRKRTIFPVADGRINFIIGGDLELRTSTLIRKHPIRGEGQRDFLGESEGSLPPLHDSFSDAGEAINDFWSMSGNFICRHHVEPRVKLDSPREESFLVPLKYIWHLQNYTYEFRCQAREAHRWLLEYWWLSKLVWSFDRFHTIYSIGRKSFQTDICGPRRD